jgi:bacteriocin-like protein
MAPPEKQETDMTEFTEISMDELDAVSGGAKVGVLNAIGSAICEGAGKLAQAAGANVLAYNLYNTAADLITP